MLQFGEFIILHVYRICLEVIILLINLYRNWFTLFSGNEL